LGQKGEINMEGPRATSKEEFKEVINLINDVFRISGNHKPTMKEEFPLLLNEDNSDNMRIILDEGRPVSAVNYLREDIFIEGSKIKAASIGAVCTAAEYRGNGYSSLILDDVERKMKEEHVDIVLISGTRSLYTRRNCIMLQNFYKCMSYPKQDETIEILEYDEKYLKNMMELYNRQSTRYYRSFDDFNALIMSATIPWGDFSYKKYVIVKNGEFVGYIVLRIIDGNSKYGQVIESLGDKNMINAALKSLAFELGVESIQSYIHVNEKHADSFDSKKLDYLEGTLKIINFVSLMENLRSYFLQYVPNSIGENIVFIEDEGRYIIKLKDEILEIDNLEKITKLVFEGKKDGITGIDDVQSIEMFIDRVFPIPFVWTANLNYQ
jgi:GNAT superfamily N-acetyltransferase